MTEEQSGNGVRVSAEERTEETRRFVSSVRRATRRRYTPEEKIRIVLEGFRRETTINDLCRQEGMNPANYYSLRNASAICHTMYAASAPRAKRKTDPQVISASSF